MLRTVVVAAALALALTGCSDNSTPAPSAPSAPAPAAPAPVVKPAPQPAPAPVVEPETEDASTPEPEVTEPSTESESTTNLESLCSDVAWRAAAGTAGDQQCEAGSSSSVDAIPEVHPDDGVVTGPGAVDPDAYGEGPSSGETQLDYACEQGYAPVELC